MDDANLMSVATLSRNYIISRAIHTIAELGLADYFSQNPKNLAIVAEEAQLSYPHLLRFLRYVSDFGFFQEEMPGYFCLTPMAAILQSTHPQSLRNAMCMVDKAWWEAAGAMKICLQTGTSSFENIHNLSFFDYLASDPLCQNRFDAGMANLSQRDNQAIAQVCDLSQAQTCVDIGGGRGGLLQALLEKFPHLKGCLLEQKQVINQHHIPDNLLNRTTLLSGNFFEFCPQNQDAYLYKGVLHDFCDQDVVHILKLCRKVCQMHSQIWIIEQIIPDEPGPHPNKTMDIVMMFLLNGEQRCAKKWESLGKEAGFVLSKIIKTQGLFSLMLFQPDRI